MRVALSLFLLSSVVRAEPDSIRPSPEWMPPAVAAEKPAGRRWGVFSTGLSLFAVSYVADIGVSYGMGHGDPGISLIPIIGPLIQLGDSYQIADPKTVKTGNPSPAIDQQSSQMVASGNQAYEALIYTGLVLDAALQLAGVITAIAGASLKKHRPVQLSSRGALSIRF